MSMITMFDDECCLASSSHVVKWLKVSLLKQTERPRLLLLLRLGNQLIREDKAFVA